MDTIYVADGFDPDITTAHAEGVVAQVISSQVFCNSENISPPTGGPDAQAG
jgi:hypothetical protein